jgi:hypothetical protein
VIRVPVLVSALLGDLLSDGPEDGMDNGNTGDPRGIDGNRQPRRAGDEPKKGKRIPGKRNQSAQGRQTRDKRQAVRSAPNREDHD